MGWGWGVIRGPAPRAGAAFPARAEDAVSAQYPFLKVGRMKCKRNRYRDRHRDQTFLAESLAAGSSIPVAISETVLNVQNAVANEIGLICAGRNDHNLVPAAMITIGRCSLSRAVTHDSPIAAAPAISDGELSFANSIH
jgi:hypothetical protein